MDQPDRDDVTLLQAHVAGDDDAFNELVRRHRDRLWAVALRTTCDPEEAADALQDALISAFRRAETFRGDAQVTTWLHRIVVNACLDRLRRRNARPTEALPDSADRAEEMADTSTANPSDTVAEVAERRADVLAALRQINADQRAALVLVDMEGYSVEEAAAMLGCAPGTVKSRCSRGRIRLVPLLAHYDPASGGDRTAPRLPADEPNGEGFVAATRRSREGLDAGNHHFGGHVQPTSRPPAVSPPAPSPIPPPTSSGGSTS